MKKIIWKFFGRQLRDRAQAKEMDAAIRQRAERDGAGMVLYQMNSNHIQRRNYGQSDN